MATETATGDDRRTLLIAQLQNANAARIADAQTVWTAFTVFGGAWFVLFGMGITQKENAANAGGLGLVLCGVGAVLLSRILAHLEKQEKLVRELEMTLGLREEHRLSSAVAVGIPVRDVLRWLGGVAGVLSLALIAWGWGF